MIVLNPDLCIPLLVPRELSATVKPVLSGHSKRTQKFCFQYRLLLKVGQKYCRMLQLSTFIKLPFSIKKFVLSVFK